MLIRAREVQFRVHEDRTTSGILLVPPGNASNTGIVIAHGAGNDMHSPLLTAFAEGLSQAGFPTLRFNFLYREEGRQTPDREEMLSAAWLAASAYLTEHAGLRITDMVAAGKSLGGRIAAQMTADGLLEARRLVFLGYPLHPSGQPERLRDGALYRIRVPMLFFAGTRDPLCNLEKLKSVLGRLHTDWELSTIEGGDHSFKVPKSSGMGETEVIRRIVEKTVDWLHD